MPKQKDYLLSKHDWKSHGACQYFICEGKGREGKGKIKKKFFLLKCNTHTESAFVIIIQLDSFHKLNTSV